MKHKADLSLSEAIGTCVVDSPYEIQRNFLLPVAKALSGIKRLTYGHDFMDSVKLSEETPIEAMIEQLDQVPLRFKSLWIEGPALFYTRDDVLKQGGNPDISVYKLRSGFLVRALPNENGFTFSSYGLNHYTEEMQAASLQQGVVIGGMVINNAIVQRGSSVDVRVTPGRKIEMNDDLMLQKMETLQKEWGQGVTAKTKSDPQIDQMIDHVFAEASFLTRAVVIMATGYVTPEMSLTPGAEQHKEAKVNASRIGNGKRPLLETTPIVTDVARMKYLRSQPKERQQQLLAGVIEIGDYLRTSKLGLIHIVHTHKRGIVPPVDRTNAPRVLTASRPVRITIDNGQIRKAFPATGKPSPT